MNTMKGYMLEKVTTPAHGTYWVMVAPDGTHFGPRMFDEKEALDELEAYVKVRRPDDFLFEGEPFAEMRGE